MDIKVIIPEEEFNQELFQSRERVFFLTKRNGVVAIRKTISTEKYESIIQKILTLILKKKGFNLKKIHFFKKKKWFVCIVEKNVFEAERNFSEMPLGDFLSYLKKNQVGSKSIYSFLKKFKENHGSSVKMEELITRYFFLISKERRRSIETLISDLEENIEMNEEIGRLINRNHF